MADPEPIAAEGLGELPIVRREISVPRLREKSMLGVRRAAAFLGIGISTATSGSPRLALTDQSAWRFFPDPAPEELTREAVEEFIIWVIGNAIRELDSHFSGFLDEVWLACEFAKLHGTEVAADFAPKGIDQKTNAASKFEIVLRALDSANDDTGALRSLSAARNSLSHSHGVVTDRYTNLKGALEVRWLGLEARLQQGDTYIVIGASPGDFGIQAPDPSLGATVQVVVVERTKKFAVGQRITLAPLDLHEICFFYMHLTERVLDALQDYLRRQGILAHEVANT